MNTLKFMITKTHETGNTKIFFSKTKTLHLFIYIYLTGETSLL